MDGLQLNVAAQHGTRGARLARVHSDVLGAVRHGEGEAGHTAVVVRADVVNTGELLLLPPLGLSSPLVLGL
jgi:hypothetical protein